MLERESVEAWEESKRKARVLGEAAATKLLSSDGADASGCSHGSNYAAGLSFLLRRMRKNQRVKTAEKMEEE